MRIDNDLNVYKLAQLYELLSKNKGSMFLVDYWMKTGKLKYISMFFEDSINSKDFNVTFEEIQYLVSFENLCEQFDNELSNLLDSKYCSTEQSNEKIEPDVAQYSRELVKELSKINNIIYNSNTSFEKIFEDFMTIVLNCISLITNLIKNNNKYVHFVSNIIAEDIFRKTVNYRTRSGKYFTF